jgi:putative FmdB family regulatory protein
MPTYEYECKKCSHRFEVFQSMSDEPVKKCPECGKQVRRLVSGGVGVIFKGSGFYVTDKDKAAVPKGGGVSKKDDVPKGDADSKKDDLPKAGASSPKEDAPKADGVSKGDTGSKEASKTDGVSKAKGKAKPAA